MAKLYFRYGAMSSGKTAILLQAVYNYESRGMNVLVMKPMIDTKGEDFLVSRIGLKRQIDHLIDEDENIYETFKDKLDQIECIFIDDIKANIEDYIALEPDRITFHIEAVKSKEEAYEIIKFIKEKRSLFAS